MDFTHEFDQGDIQANKTMAIIAYIGLLGWLIALLAAPKESRYVKFHMNQSIINCLIALIPFVNIVAFVFMIIGIVGVSEGKAKELPVIGKFRLMKY